MVAAGRVGGHLFWNATLTAGELELFLSIYGTGTAFLIGEILLGISGGCCLRSTVKG